MRRNLKNNRDVKIGPYLEVYVREDGFLVFSPITNNTSKVIKEISKDSKNPKIITSAYCG